MGKSGTSYSWSESKARERLSTAIENGTMPVRHIPIEEVVERDGAIVVDLKSRDWPDFTPAVSKGALLLDSVDPEWYLHIDVDKLNLDDENMCVLGQSWNHYETLEKAFETVPRGDVEYGAAPTTNFRRFTRMLFPGKGNDYAVATAVASEYGFAFSSVTYDWLNLEAIRRRNAGGTNGANAAVDRELWEQLSKTWITLIKARQEKHAVRLREQELRRNKDIDAIRGWLRTTLGLGWAWYNVEGARVAARLYDAGLDIDKLKELDRAELEAKVQEKTPTL